MPNSTSASDNPSRPASPPGGRPRPRPKRRLARLAGLCLAGLAGFVLLVLAALLTPAGLRGAAFLAEQAIHAASGMTATIRDVSGTLPFSLRLGRFALADEEGIWLVVSDARLAWSPSALLRGRVLIDEATADVVRLRRAPQLPPSAAPPQAVEWPPRFPRLPAILVDRLAVNRLILDAPVAGQDAVIAVTGRLAESGGGVVALALEATRLDGEKPLALRLGGALDYAAWKLSAKATLSDAPGGLLSAALAGPGGGALTVQLAGDGPLSAWKGRLSGDLSGKAFLRADLGLAVPLDKAATGSFSLDAGLVPPPGLLPAPLAAVAGESPACRLAGRFGILSGEFFLDDATLTTAAGTVTATAHLPPDGKDLAAAATVRVPQASLLDPSLSGAVTAEAKVSGNLEQPALSLRLRAADFAAGPARLASADVTATAGLSAPAAGDFPGASLTLSGDVAGLAGPDGTTLLGDALRLSLDAAVDRQGVLTAKSLSIDGQGGKIALTDVRLAGGRASGDAAASVADVAGAASLAGLRLTGGFSLKAAVTADAAGRGQAALRAEFSRLAGPAAPADDPLSAMLAALAGPAPRLTAAVDFSADGLRARDLAFDGKGVGLTGTGTVDAAGTLSAKAALKAPDLSVLEPPLGGRCAGAVDLDVEFSGKAAAPRLAVKGSAQKLAVGELALAGATLEGAADDAFGAPSGRIALSARREGETAKLETAFALSGDRLTVKDLRLAAPDAAFSGEAAISLASGRVTGKLSGNASNLAGLGRFTGQRLAGALRLTATAEAGRDGQSLTADVGATNLALPGLSAARLTVAANLGDVTGNPRGKATLSGSGLAAGGAALSSLSLTATGDGRALAASVEAKGTIPGGKALDMAAKASLAASGKGRTVTVSALSGSLDGRRFSLTAPAALGFSPDTTSLTGLSLAFDKARLEASASLGLRGVSGKATVGSFPLPLLAAFGAPVMGGTGTVTATLSGSLAKPEITAEARLEGLSLAAEKAKNLTTLAVRAEVAAGGGKATLKAGVSPTGKKEAVTVEASVPLRLSLSPFAWDLPPGGALSGRVATDSDLTQMAALLAQANTRIDGRLTADMRLGGTLAAPSLSGSLALAAKKLENADAGLVLHNVLLRADASGGTLTVTQGSGQDGRGGSFTLTGQIGVSDLVNGPVDLALRLTRLRVAGLDLATVTADGTANVTGTLSRMRATGKIVLGPADINLPTSLPPEVTVIPVTLVNDPSAPKKKAKAAPPAAARHIDLDLTVALGQAVYVRGLGLESRWAGEVKVTGTAAAPRVMGRYFVEKGQVELFGSNLEISKGEIVFHGETPPAPTFDILAQHTANDVTAGVAITGDAANPSINLVSQPTLPHDEILSRILFGQSAATLSPLQAAQLAQAAASLYAGGTPTSILARTRRILGLDQLTLVSGGGKGGIGSTVLKAGKEIVKGVTVGVEQGMGAQTGAVSVEVQVTPNITIDSRVGANNKQGVGVNWKWDY